MRTRGVVSNVLMIVAAAFSALAALVSTYVALVPVVLAQIDPKDLAEGLTSSPLAWILVVALFAVWFLFRELRSEQAAHRATISEHSKEGRDLLKEIIPVHARVAETLDRALDKING